MMAVMAVRKEVPLSLRSFLILVVLAIGLGSFYRFPGLERRPMHTDEAILGMKLGEFWQSGHFQYDPKDYHGPALHQVSWMWGHLAGWGDPQSWTEADLRLVAVLCGMGVLLVTLLFTDALGRTGTGLAMLLTAVSPMMVFYSRYFIMEMLLVLLVALSLACFWRYAQGGTRLWLLLGGCAAGFQHATKETFILNLGAALCGWVAARVLVGRFEPRKGTSFSIGPARKKGRPAQPWLWVVVPAIFISVAAYSGWFRDWQAVKDSALTYASYLERSGGSGHEKPWHYYLTLIFWRKDTLVWSEAMIGGLAILGMAYSLLGQFKNTARHAFLVFLTVYALALFTVYSLLGYKTPWSILSAQHALILLAGVGGGAVWQAASGRFLRLVCQVLIAAGLYHLCSQSMRLTGTNANPQLEYSADPRNPYVYSHTQKSLLKLLEEVRAYAASKGGQTSLQVISQDSGWPLPWYWRGWKRAGFQDQAPTKLDADIIVVDGEHVEQVKALINPGDYTEQYPYGLRPGILLSLFVKKEKAPEPQPVAPVIQPAAAPVPLPDSLTTPMPLPGTLSTPPPAFSPTLPALPGAPAPTPPP